MLRATKYDGAEHSVQPFRVLADDGNLLVTEYRARTPIFTPRRIPLALQQQGVLLSR